MKVKVLVFILGSFLLFSCGNSKKKNPFERNPLGENSTSELEENNNGGQEAQLVSCPMCNGTGIFDFMPGDVMAPKQTCGACNGSGICDVNTAQQVMQAKEQKAYQIEYDLKKAHELLESMEEAYANADGVVVRAQYPRMIADQKERIRQLEVELRSVEQN